MKCDDKFELELYVFSSLSALSDRYENTSFSGTQRLSTTHAIQRAIKLITPSPPSPRHLGWRPLLRRIFEVGEIPCSACFRHRRVPPKDARICTESTSGSRSCGNTTLCNSRDYTSHTATCSTAPQRPQTPQAPPPGGIWEKAFSLPPLLPPSFC